MNSEKPPAENTLRCLKPLWRTVRDGVPLAVFCILELVPLTLMLVLSGHDSLDSLEVVSLYFATDYTFIEIVHHAAGQAFQGPIAMAVGARDWMRVRTEFQRALVSATLIFACLSPPVVLLSYWGYLLFGQSSSIAATSAICLAIGLPDELAGIVHSLVCKTLIANHKIWPVVASSAVLLVTGVGFEWFAFCIGSGPIGLVIAYALANATQALFVVAIAFALPAIRDLKLFHWSRASFTHLWQMISLFLKSLLYVFSNRVFVQVGTIAFGLLGEAELDAQSVLLRFTIIANVCSVGFWSKAVAAMGRAAGAGKRDKLLATFVATLVIFVFFAALTFVVLVAFRYPLAYATTSLSSVQVIVIQVMPVVAVYAAVGILWNGSQSLAFSLGRIDLVTLAIVICSFGIGIPSALLLMFSTSLGVFGFYIGLIVCYSAALAILWTYYAYYWKDLLQSGGSDADSASESSPLVSKSKGDNKFTSADNGNSIASETELTHLEVSPRSGRQRSPSPDSTEPVKYDAERATANEKSEPIDNELVTDRNTLKNDDAFDNHN